jgi:tryptophan halogenase
MKICIIGGGTAGWLTALWINKLCPGQHSVTVIESSKIGIIGAGEGTTGIFQNIVQNRWADFGINEADFMRETGATQKMGIEFVNWHGDGAGYIAPIDNTIEVSEHADPVLIDHCLTQGLDRVHLSTICGNLAEHNLSSVDRDLKTTYGYNAYHFDGHRVGQYFKKLAEPLCAAVIDSEVTAVHSQDGLVTGVDLANGTAVTADYWIDASGFARVISRHLGTAWHSYGQYLTCDRAMPFLLKHSKDIRPLTVSHAMTAGWMWQIPTQDRIGAGYVYDSRYLTDEAAQAEVEQLLGQAITPIKWIKFDPGRLDQFYTTNTMSLGLAGSFLEPLQATSIHTTVAQLQAWHQLTAEKITLAQANSAIARVVDEFADLVQLHYRSGRSDTAFWQHQQHIPMRPGLAMIKNIAQTRWPVARDFAQSWGAAGYGVFIYPLINYRWIKWSLHRTTEFYQGYGARWRRHCQQITKSVLSQAELLSSLDRCQSLTLSLRYDTIAEPIQTQDLHPFLRQG